MVSRAEKNDKWLKSRAKKLHDSTFPEDTLAIVRPTDADLYSYVDKFTEDYSWREDILRSEMSLQIFSSEIHQPHESRIYDILRWLRKEKFLHFTNVDDDGWLLVSGVDDLALNELLGTLKPTIVPANIQYSPSTSTVTFNGVSHKMHKNGDTHKILHYLATRPNERISKERIWRCINKRVASKRDRNAFSSLINRVRTSVGASDKEILLDNTVTLNATVQIID